MTKSALYFSILEIRGEVREIRSAISLALLKEQPSVKEIEALVQQLQNAHHTLRPLLFAYYGNGELMEQYDELLFRLDMESILFVNGLVYHRIETDLP